MRAFSLLVCISLGLASGLLPAHAQSGNRSMRCGNDLANVGDSRAAVLSKCGEPQTKDSYCKKPEPLPPGTAPQPAQACEMVDEWTYKPARGQLMTTLRFEGGRLVQISYGERVQ